MFESQTVNEGDCIDNDYIAQLFNNIRELRECSATNSEQFVCTSIDQEQTGSVRIAAPTEMCFDLQTLSGTVNPNVGADKEQKMLMFVRKSTNNVNISDSNNATVGITRTARIVCNGQTIKTIQDTSGAANMVISEFECEPDSDIQLCFDSQLFAASGQPGLVNGTQTIQICAALICIKDVQNGELSGYFMPPTIPDGCKLGREAIHLASQNTTALRNAFARFGQVASTDSFSFDDQDEHVLEFNSPTVMDFLILGNIQVTGTNTSTYSEASLAAGAVITCGSTRINCLSAEIDLPEADDGPTTRTLTLPVLACGQCAPGDTLTAGLRSQVQCNEVASEATSGISASVVSAEQNYCVFKFKRIETEFGDPVDRSIGECLDLDHLQAINESLDIIKEVCDNQEPITLEAISRGGFGDNNSVIPLTIAAMWPPPNDPNTTAPPPIRRAFLALSVRPCATLVGGINREELRQVRASVIVKCGGTEVARSTVSWTLTRSGTLQRCGPDLDILQCIECPINQAITIEFEGIGLGSNLVAPDDYSYQLTYFGF